MNRVSERLAGFLRSAARELRNLRGEVITAAAVAAVAAVLLDETAAKAIGVAAIIMATAAILVLSARLRSSSGTDRGGKPRTEPPTMEERSQLAGARWRLEKLASNLGLESSPADEASRGRVGAPLVSVVMPCHNDESYVTEALQSVAQQSYQNWECIVVDDASTDSSWNAIGEAVSGEPRFQTLRLDSNKGSGAARNRGLEAASGEYVAFLDADDLLLEESLGDRVSALMEYRDDPSVIGSFCAVRSESESVALSALPARRHATQAPFIDFVTASGECPFTIHAPLVSLDRIRALGGFDESMTTGAVDWDLWYRTLRNGYVFVPSKTLGAVYRQKQGGITRSNKAEHTSAGARLIRAAFTQVDPDVLTAPAPFPMAEPLGTYRAHLVVAERAIRFASMALAEGDVGDMRKTLAVLDRGTWPLIDRHIDWNSVVGRGVVRVLGLRPKDVPNLGEALSPFVFAVRQATEEATT
jgi:teichuronic acid biosynthesis glycosyltransferase TuaG